MRDISTVVAIFGEEMVYIYIYDISKKWLEHKFLHITRSLP